ncbi:hypothetical protein C8Q73DRAFT_285790 [Cubamyces lactineus]|nr:hypothetical protein C8Q73DRAFT_285790 [Cubamyces lactineus]
MQMESTNGGPPWFAYFPDGSVRLGGVPERLLHHPEMHRRGITLTDALKPAVVFRAASDKPAYVVKVLDLDTEELQIYERLLSDIDSPRNHTIPCDIYREGHPLLIMPYVNTLSSLVEDANRSPSQLLDMFCQLTEGVEYLHSLHIAHLDICEGNVIAALPYDAQYHPSVVARKIYLIDFNTSKQLRLGPGVQHAITLPPTQIPPPDDLKHFDPYSWDVYCLGRLCQDVIESYSYDGRKVPWIAQWYARWLLGKEQGCHTVCRCRPTARTARRMLFVIRFLLPVVELCESFYLRTRKRPAE